MRAGTVGLLAALGVVAVAGGWYFGTRTTPSERTTMAGADLMFPNLAPRLHDANRVEITHQGKQTVIEKRADHGWGVASMRDYPVQEAKLRGLLTGLTELRLIEPRTSDPAEFVRLGVDDPNAPASTADLLRVVDATGKPVLAVIVGHRRVRTQTNIPEEVYVRRPDENQSWLAEGAVQVDADPNQWLDRNVMNIAHDRVASVMVVNTTEPNPAGANQAAPNAASGDGAGDSKTLLFGRTSDGKFVLTEPAEHPKLEDYKVDDVARALELLTFQSVKPDADAAGIETGHAVFTLNGGLAVKITVLHAEKDIWARFAVSASSDTAKVEADRLTSRLAGWSYQIGAWKEKSLVPTIDSLKAAVSPALADAPIAADSQKAGDDRKPEDPRSSEPPKAAPSDAAQK